jgi:putative multiple sugar transport system substrate-binding protein
VKLSKIAAGATGVALAMTLAACGSSTKTADKAGASGGSSGGSAAGALVGVTMPTRQSERWIHDGDNVKAGLEKLGYKVDLEYANNDIPTQANQLENQISMGAKVLIVASIDGTALSNQLQAAHDKGIKVISYDRLLMKSPNVDYYARSPEV